MKLRVIAEVLILFAFIIFALSVTLVRNEASPAINRDAKGLVNQGNELYKAGRAKFNDAAQRYLDALKVNPNIGEARLKLAEIYYEYIWNYEALNELDKLREIEPKYPGLYLLAGKIYNRLGEPEKAAEAFKEAVILQPEDSEAHYFLGTVYQQQNNELEAIKEYEKAIQDVSEKTAVASSYLQLGRIYRARPDTQELAENALKSALAMEPNSVEVISELRSLYREQSENYESQFRYDKAAEKYEEIVKLEPDNTRNVEYYIKLGNIYRSEELFDKATLMFEAVIKLDPLNFDAFAALKELELLKMETKGY